jgi:4-amino-4-deoxy-L-arabinose transferase-like glycosyltransferase
MEIYSFNRNYNRCLEYPVLIIILGVAFFLRIYNLENYPSQIHVDEISNIYDGYSIAETGADRWGVKYPVILRAYGESDNRPPMYAWLSAVSIKILGYSVFAGRLPSVIFGMLSLLLLFFTTRKIGGTLFAYLSLLLMSLSPWHITMSRLALEAGTLTPFFMIFAIYIFIRVKESNFKVFNIVCLGLCIGFATSAYQSAKLIFFLVSVIWFCDLLWNSPHRLKTALIFVLSTGIGAMPQLYAATVLPDQFFSRATGTMISFSLSFDYFQALGRNFFLNLSPEFLFLDFGSYNNLTIARLLTVEMSFFYVGLLSFYWKLKSSKNLNPIYIYMFVILSILPSALTPDNPHALRTSCNVVLFPMISAAGILIICHFIKNESWRVGAIFAISLMIIFNSVSNIKVYTNNAELIGAGQQNLLVKLAMKLVLYKDQYSQIFIEDIGNQPYMYIVGYCNVHPEQFQNAYKQIEGNGWDHFTQFDKYFFLPKEDIIKASMKNKKKSLLILKSKNKEYQLMDSVGIHNEKLFFYDNSSPSKAL